MQKKNELLLEYQRKLEKALGHLAYSLRKINRLPTDPSQLDEESLETWESFAARFSRATDLFLTRYLRAKVLENDPGFQGSLRDFVDQAEKLRLIDHADEWMEIRGLRNITAHEYEEDDLKKFFEALKQHAPKVLSALDKGKS